MSNDISNINSVFINKYSLGLLCVCVCVLMLCYLQCVHNIILTTGMFSCQIRFKHFCGVLYLLMPVCLQGAWAID